MKRYKIHYTPEALEDMDNVYHYIADKLMSPDTAIDYRNGIYDTIQRLAIVGGAIAINQRDYLQRHYGAGVRTVTYKKMTVMFNIIDDVALIRRVIAGSLIL
jgi:plasmid stabilization system protein ParE